MTHRSLFKEVAQRIVQSAQSSENDGSLPPASVRNPSGLRNVPPGQMMGGTSLPPAQFASPADGSAVNGR